MSVALVSDIHGNLPALEAVVADVQRRGVARVLQGGDLALGGCRPAEVIDLVRELGWAGVVGNTDELLWRPEQRAVQERQAPGLHALLNLLFEAWAPATRELIGDDRLRWLHRLSDEHREGDLVSLHASPGDLWRAPAADADEADLVATYAPCHARTVVYGHIHRPYVRRAEALTIANSGSVGSPFDGDPRASYLIWQAGELELVRVEYDVEREVSLLQTSGYPDARRIAETRRRGRFVPVAST
jgi:predicted phosphodiesterase